MGLREELASISATEVEDGFIAYVTKAGDPNPAAIDVDPKTLDDYYALRRAAKLTIDALTHPELDPEQQNRRILIVAVNMMIGTFVEISERRAMAEQFPDFT